MAMNAFFLVLCFPALSFPLIWMIVGWGGELAKWVRTLMMFNKESVSCVFVVLVSRS